MKKVLFLLLFMSMHVFSQEHIWRIAATDNTGKTYYYIDANSVCVDGELIAFFTKTVSNEGILIYKICVNPVLKTFIAGEVNVYDTRGNFITYDRTISKVKKYDKGSIIELCYNEAKKFK